MEQKDTQAPARLDVETGKRIPFYFAKGEGKLKARNAFMNLAGPRFFESEDKEEKRVECDDGDEHISVAKRYDENGKFLRTTIITRKNSRPEFTEVILHEPRNSTAKIVFNTNTAKEVDYQVNNLAAFEKSDLFLSNL